MASDLGEQSLGLSICAVGGTDPSFRWCHDGSIPLTSLSV